MGAKFLLENGLTADVPEDKVDVWMQRMDKRGIHFESAQNAGEPEASQVDPEFLKYQAPGPVQLPEMTITGERPGILEQFLGMAGRGRAAAGSNPATDAPEGLTPADRSQMNAGIGETAYDMTLAANRGLTHGLSSKAFGDDEAQAAARSRSPMAYGLTEQAARIPGDIAMTAATGPYAPAAIGAVDGYADSRGDVLDQLVDTAKGGAIGAGAGLAGGAINKLGQGAGAAEQALMGAARKARTAAVGATGADLKKLAQSRGLDYVEGDLGDLPTQLGVTNRLLPQSPSQYAQRFGDRAAQANEQIGQSISDAEAQGLDRGFVSKAPIDEALQRAQGAAAHGPLGDRASAANAFGSVRGALEDQTVNTPSQLRNLKSTYDSAAYPNQLQGSSESFMGQAHKTAADAARGQLRDVMGYALPETEQAFTQGNADYGSSKVLEELARNRGAQQYAGGGLAGNLGAGAIGAGVGATFGGTAGAVSGAALGFARPALAAAQQYGPDLGANLATLGSQGAGRMANAVPGARGFANMPMGQTGAATGGADVLEQFVGGDPRDQAQRSMAEGRGYMLPDVIEKLAYSDPQQLGPYAQKFQEALNAEGGSRVNALLLDLQQNDPDFRTQVLPRLQAMTAGQR